jgi:ligand-binding sensor domain-containing protein
LAIPFLSFAKAILYEGRDGLSSNDISAIAKDSRGLMWIGTYNGINIYDGYTFTKLHGELSNLHITTLVINNSRNELLAGTNLGLYSIDLNTFKVSKIGVENKKAGHWSNKKAQAVCFNLIRKRYLSFLKKGTWQK